MTAPHMPMQREQNRARSGCSPSSIDWAPVPPCIGGQRTTSGFRDRGQTLRYCCAAIFNQSRHPALYSPTYCLKIATGAHYPRSSAKGAHRLRRSRTICHLSTPRLDFVQNLLTSTSRKSRLWRFRPELPRGVR